jgi:hypothetical protein
MLCVKQVKNVKATLKNILISIPIRSPVHFIPVPTSDIDSTAKVP